MAFLGLDPQQLQFLIKIVIALVIAVALIIADRLVRRAIARYSSRLKLEKHIENVLKLIARIAIIAIGLPVILQQFYIDIGVAVLSVSALAGAAIGFAATQTVGNFLAGFYIMISRPFLVNDYVKIGDVEGHVREITVNYTKIYTPTYNLMEIPNRAVLDSKILNYSKGATIDYTFQIGFSHDLTNEELIKECIAPAIDKFYEKYKGILPKKPEFSMYKMGRVERGFNIRMFFPEKKIETFYEIQPELIRNIANNWDAYRKQKA